MFVARALHLRKIANIKLYSSTAPVMAEGVGVSMQKVISVLEKFAPKQLAESWDNTGLLVEPYTPRNISKILLTNDLTEDVALEANSHGCEMIISYHPPIFTPLKSVVQSSWKEKIVSFLLEKRISLYSPHTSWDSVQGGVNDWLGSAFEVAQSRPLLPGTDPKVGAGRYLQLKSSIPLSDAINKVKELTGLKYVRFALARGKTMTDTVETVALCAGSGASVLKGVHAGLYLTVKMADLLLEPNRLGFSQFITNKPWPWYKRTFNMPNQQQLVSFRAKTGLSGEMLHHDVLDAAQKGTSVILTNHSDSERGYLQVFSYQLEGRLENEVKVIISQCDKDPLVTV